MAMQRPLDVSILSATGLKNVNFFSKLEVYAVAWLSSDPKSKLRTAADREGGKNPSWKGETLRFFIPDGDTSGLILSILLRCERVLGDRDIGEVNVPLKELESGDGRSDRIVTYAVRRPSGKSKGALNFSVKIGDPVAAPAPPPVFHPPPYAAPPPQAYPPSGDYPVTAYPPGPSTAYPPQGYPTAYPPQGYGAPPPGYGYPPPAYGYGAPPIVKPQKPKKNNLGLGLGAGLVGGALGGLIIGDMISDAADYDGGFDDGGGFDF